MGASENTHSHLKLCSGILRFVCLFVCLDCLVLAGLGPLQVHKSAACAQADTKPLEMEGLVLSLRPDYGVNLSCVCARALRKLRQKIKFHLCMTDPQCLHYILLLLFISCLILFCSCLNIYISQKKNWAFVELKHFAAKNGK